MARARNIKPGFMVNDDLAECGIAAHLLFACLWMIADKEGRFKDKPKRIKALCLPYYSQDQVNVEASLSQLQAKGFIRRYTVDGEHYCEITNWHKHQTPHHKESASELPAPPADELVKTNTKATLPQACVNVASSLLQASESENQRIQESENPESENQSIQESGRKRFASDDLQGWISFWNTLKAKDLVATAVNENPSRGVRAGWQRVQKCRELQVLLANPEAIEEAIRKSEFVRAGWFSLAKLFGGKNQDGEYIVAKLLEGGFVDMSKRPRAANVGPGVNHDGERMRDANQF